MKRLKISYGVETGDWEWRDTAITALVSASHIATMMGAYKAATALAPTWVGYVALLAAWLLTVRAWKPVMRWEVSRRRAAVLKDHPYAYLVQLREAFGEVR